MVVTESFISQHPWKIKMLNTLIVFIGSGNVGTYINAMSHAIEMHEIDHIVLIDLLEVPYEKRLDFSDFVNNTLWQAIKDLDNGNFGKDKIEITDDFQTYKKLMDIYGNKRDIDTKNYQFLKDELNRLKEKYGNESMIDISGVPKRVAFDILAGCLAVGFDKIVTFELKQQLRDSAALYHNLKSMEYEHVKLSSLEQFQKNIEHYKAIKNRKRNLTIVAAFISAMLTLAYTFTKLKIGGPNWIFVSVVMLFTFFGGILSVLDAWGGLRINYKTKKF